MKPFVPAKFFLHIAIRVAIFLLAPVYSLAQSDNCATATALTSAPGCFNTAGALTVPAIYTVIPAPGCSLGAFDDVWYTFIANSSNPTITLSANTVVNVQLQIFSGTCAALVSVACGTPSIVAAGLTPGNTYFVRIYSTTNAAGTFNICITDPNNLCGAAANSVLLTSSTICNNIPGNIYGATLAPAPTITAPDCAAGVTRDVWYRFVAQTTNPTITLSSIGVNFTNPGMQLLSNNCGSTFTTFFCGTTSIAADFLVPGTTYFIRVYSTTIAAPISPVGAGFNICITDPIAAVPPNDECATAINLLISASCSNIPGTVSGSTYNGSIPIGCAPATPAYDVWYKFTALTASSTITLSGAGSNFITPRIQLFSGTCGGLVSMACGTPTITNATVTGTTYYVRVYSTTGPAPTGNADFNICVAATGALVRYGNSYVNITRKTTGGVVQAGDVLEIRMTINHTSGTMTQLRFVDNVPTKTTMAIAAPHDSIKVITNEGLRFRKYTLAGGDDAGTYKAIPLAGEYNVRLNLGFGATGATPTSPGIPTVQTNALGGAVGSMNAGSDRPRGGGGMLFAVAYRVVVTGVAGDTILLNPPQFIYNNAGTDVTLTGTAYKIAISNPLTLCTNSIGVNIASEFGGTFGSGTTPNRPTDLTFPISGYSFISNVNANNNVGDGRYGIVKNVSPRNRTVTAAQRQPTCAGAPTMNINDPLNCNNRMFGHWYIDGDHTGTNNAAGNPPPAAGVNGGYMLLVNADYVASEIYRQDLINLCPNTYYEFSAWIKNVCATCGADSIGAQFTGTPTAPASGYVGVYPNLTFALNGLDYYNTGEVDTIGWQKRGFVFKTGLTQTTATFSIRNNSQGAGGNDWAVDDIAVATCFPGMVYSPSAAPNVCENNILTITDTVRSIFNNYIEYKWQRWEQSTSGPWIDIPGASGTATPVWNPGLGVYEYWSNYTIPASETTPAHDGDLYRLVVASTVSNLAGTACSYTDPTTITLNVLIGCGPPLKADLLSATGRLTDNIGKISWVTSKEDEPVRFSIERSDDGITFKSITIVNGYNNITTETNNYSYTDPVAVTSKVYYRVVMINNQNTKKYSSTIQLNPNRKNIVSFVNVVNPFNTELRYEISSPDRNLIKIELIDGFGKIVRTETQQVDAGTNSLGIYNTSTLPGGIYVLRAFINGNMIYRKVMKEK